MNDTERLDAIGEYGLCVATHDTLGVAGWDRTWVCQYAAPEPKVAIAPTIREAIDTAVLDIRAAGLSRN